jgi:hypothetical protein
MLVNIALRARFFHCEVFGSSEMVGETSLTFAESRIAESDPATPLT